MKLPLLTFLAGLLFSFAAHSADLPWEAFVTSKQAYVWSEPGWTYQDCEAPSANDRRWSEREQTVRNIRREQAAAACAKRQPDHLLRETQKVTVLTREVKENNRTYRVAEYQDRTILYRGHEETVRFYKVRIKAKNENGELVEYDGYMSADQISDPDQVRPSRPALPKPCKDCQTLGFKANPEAPIDTQVASNLLDLTSKIEDLKFPDFKVKSDEELAMFTCLHRRNTRNSGEDSKSEVDEFFERFPQFVKAAQQAEEAFGVPKELIRCAMMVESGLKRNMVSPKGARGYAQVMPRTMDDMISFGQKSPYKEMWAQYQATNPAANFWRMRDSNNIPAATGAMAMYFRYIFDTELTKAVEKQACRDCSGDLKHLKRKDIALMTMSYNGGFALINGTSKFPKGAASMSLSAIQRSSSIPSESKAYIIKIEACMQSGLQTSFTENADKLRSIQGKRRQDIAKLKERIAYRNKVYASNMAAYEKNMATRTPPKPIDEQNQEDEAKIATLQNLIQMNANHSYANRINDCKQRLPAGTNSPASVADSIQPAPAAAANTQQNAPASAQ